MLSGPIPSSIGDASSLEEIDLSSNQISGKIPKSIGKLARHSRLSLGTNRII
jgi:Leucine-rich repeat (LRR) protein